MMARYWRSPSTGTVSSTGKSPYPVFGAPYPTTIRSRRSCWTRVKRRPFFVRGWVMSDSEARHIVLAIHGRHADAILCGKKTHELRRRLPAVSEGDYVYLYATAPQSAVVGGFRIKRVRREGPRQMWKLVGRRGFAISKAEFEAYVAGASEVVALEVAEPVRLRRSAPVGELAGLDSGFRPPQSAVVLRSPSLRNHLEALASGPRPTPSAS